jgi:hypothetical protein
MGDCNNDIEKNLAEAEERIKKAEAKIKTLRDSMNTYMDQLNYNKKVHADWMDYILYKLYKPLVELSINKKITQEFWNDTGLILGGQFDNLARMVGPIAFKDQWSDEIRNHLWTAEEWLPEAKLAVGRRDAKQALACVINAEKAINLVDGEEGGDKTKPLQKLKQLNQDLINVLVNVQRNTEEVIEILKKAGVLFNK